MLRENQSKFIDSLTVSKRGNLEFTSNEENKIAVSKNDVKRMLKNFERSPDIQRNTLDMYKQRADLDDNSKQVAKDFFNDLSQARKTKKKMSLCTAMSYRKSGIFKVAGRDVYEDLETGDFWKVSEDKKHVIRLFNEDEKGIADKRASKLNEYTVMGSHPGDGGVVKAETFLDAAAIYFSQEGEGYTKEEILKDLEKRPGKQISDTEYEIGDYTVKLVTKQASNEEEYDDSSEATADIEKVENLTNALLKIVETKKWKNWLAITDKNYNTHCVEDNKKLKQGIQSCLNMIDELYNADSSKVASGPKNLERDMREIKNDLKSIMDIINDKETLVDIDPDDIKALISISEEITKKIKELENGKKNASGEKITEYIGPGVTLNLSQTMDLQGFNIYIKGSFRSGDDFKTTLKKIKDFWNSLDIDNE